MVFNKRLQKVLKEAQGFKSFDYDNVLKKNNELKKNIVYFR